jgi:molecular chaperone GrpE
LAKNKDDLTATQTQDSPGEKADAEKDKVSPEKKTSEKKLGLKEMNDLLEAEKDRVLRLSAEFENYKKRKQRELDEFRKFANETVFRQLLTVADNLERAISAAPDTETDDGLLGGVKLTHKEVIKLFDAFSVRPVEAGNKPFDPNFHQAVHQEATDKVPENTVTEVLQKGYMLHDRLIRPAMVVVSKKCEKETEKTKEN